MRKMFRRFAKIYLPRYWMQKIKKTVIKPLADSHKTLSTCCDSKITIKIRVASTSIPLFLGWRSIENGNAHLCFFELFACKFFTLKLVPTCFKHSVHEAEHFSPLSNRSRRLPFPYSSANIFADVRARGVRRWLMLDNLLRDIWIWKSLSTREITTWRQVEKWEGEAAYITQEKYAWEENIYAGA